MEILSVLVFLVSEKGTPRDDKNRDGIIGNRGAFLSLHDLNMFCLLK